MRYTHNCIAPVYSACVKYYSSFLAMLSKNIRHFLAAFSWTVCKEYNTSRQHLNHKSLALALILSLQIARLFAFKPDYYVDKTSYFEYGVLHKKATESTG